MPIMVAYARDDANAALAQADWIPVCQFSLGPATASGRAFGVRRDRTARPGSSRRKVWGRRSAFSTRSRPSIREPGVCDQSLVNPMPISTVMPLHASRGRRRLYGAAPTSPGCRPPVPTFFPFDVLDLVGQGRAEQRKHSRSP
jgi:hypothetical protein